MTFETNSFETTFIWDHDIWDKIHFKPINLRNWDHLIWDQVHLRSRPSETCSFETMFISDHARLRPRHLTYDSYKIRAGATRIICRKSYAASVKAQTWWQVVLEIQHLFFILNVLQRFEDKTVDSWSCNQTFVCRLCDFLLLIGQHQFSSKLKVNWY